MPKNEALLVIDVQRVYMEPEAMVTSDGDDLIPKCRGLVARAHEADVPVIFVQHISDDQPDDPDLIAVHPDLAPTRSEAVIQKHFGSAFFQTSLKSMLTKLNAKTLYICGLATFGCVNATVLCALCKNYDVRIVRNAHGSRSYGDTSATRMIEIFNATWEEAGATLIQAEDVDFSG